METSVARLEKPLISIIEDDIGVRNSLKSPIGSLGYDSGTFATAEEFLESELLHSTACLISDVHLPGISGPDLQARLTADGYRIPIVFVTGFVSEAMRIRVLKAGALGYFAKPLEAGVFVECLEKALAGIPCY